MIEPRLWREDEKPQGGLIDISIGGHVIDLPNLRPEHERVAKFIGKWLGILVVYLIAGLYWTAWGAAWVARWSWRRFRT